MGKQVCRPTSCTFGEAMSSSWDHSAPYHPQLQESRMHAWGEIWQSLFLSSQLCWFSKLGGNPGRSYALRTGKQRLPGRGTVAAGSGLRAPMVVAVVAVAVLPCGVRWLFERHFSLPVTWADSPLLLVTLLTFLPFFRLSPFFRCCFSK